MDIKEQHEGVRTKSERLKYRRQKGTSKSTRNYSASTLLVRGRPKWINLPFNKKERQPADETGALFNFFPLQLSLKINCEPGDWGQRSKICRKTAGQSVHTQADLKNNSVGPISEPPIIIFWNYYPQKMSKRKKKKKTKTKIS